MTSRNTGDMPHIQCVVVDEDTVRFGGDEFSRVRTCFIEGYHEDSSGVSWLLSCDHDVDGYTKPCYCSVCGARVVDTVLDGEQE